MKSLLPLIMLKTVNSTLIFSWHPVQTDWCTNVLTNLTIIVCNAQVVVNGAWRVILAFVFYKTFVLSVLYSFIYCNLSLPHSNLKKTHTQYLKRHNTDRVWSVIFYRSRGMQLLTGNWQSSSKGIWVLIHFPLFRQASDQKCKTLKIVGEYTKYE